MSDVFRVFACFGHVARAFATDVQRCASAMATALILRTNLNQGVPGPEHFELRQLPRPQIGDGILVQLLVVSADPYMRYRIRSDGDYKANAPMLGLVAGKVLESKVSEWEPGDLFGAELPYIDIQAVPASKLAMFRRLTGLLSEDPIHVRVCVRACVRTHTSERGRVHFVFIAYARRITRAIPGDIMSQETISRGIGALGMPGHLGLHLLLTCVGMCCGLPCRELAFRSTAYGGLTDILRPKNGEVLWVSGAAGCPWQGVCLDGLLTCLWFWISCYFLLPRCPSTPSIPFESQFLPQARTGKWTPESPNPKNRKNQSLRSVAAQCCTPHMSQVSTTWVVPQSTRVVNYCQSRTPKPKKPP